MEGIKLIDEAVGNTFLRLVGSPLHEEQLMSLPVLERALYVVCKVKVGYWDDRGHHTWLDEHGEFLRAGIDINGPANHELFYLLFPALNRKVSTEAIRAIMQELVRLDLWNFGRRFNRSPQLRNILAALIIYQEGGYVEFDGARHWLNPTVIKTSS